MKIRLSRFNLLFPCTLQLFLLIGFLQGGARAKDHLIKYSSPEVRLYTDIDKEAAGKVMDDIAFFADYIDKYFQDYRISRKKKNPIRCRLFARYEDFSEFGRKANVLSQSGAYFSASNNCIVAPYREGSDAALSTLRHECAHQILDRYFNKLPPWIDEGLACYFGGLEFDTHRNLISSCGSNARLKSMRGLLAKETCLDWNHVFGIELRSVFDDEIRRGVLDMGKFYDQSWGVVFFYLHTSDENARGFFRKIIKGMNTGRSRPNEAADDFIDRGRAFVEFMREDHEKVSILYKSAVVLRSKRSYKEALDKLLALLDRDPMNTAALRFAGETAYAGELFDKALPFWTLLDEQDPKNPDYQWRICRCMVEAGLARHDQEQIQMGVEKGLEAVELTRSQDPDSLAALAMAYHAAGDCSRALKTIRKATRFSCAFLHTYKNLEKRYSREIIEGTREEE